jgi:CBS domain-containing protein
MIVGGFMVPAEKVATCLPTDTIKQAMDTMLEKKVGSVVVLSMTNAYHMQVGMTNAYHMPVGIVTNTDFVSAYKQGLTLDHAVKEIMSKNLQTCDINLSIDGAAALLERNKTHHAIVVDGNKHFQGLISSWDIASECAKDNKAFPWNRSPDGRFHKPDEKVDLLATSPTSTAENVRPGMHSGQMGDSFRAYVDNLGYFD